MFGSMMPPRAMSMSVVLLKPVFMNVVLLTTSAKQISMVCAANQSHVDVRDLFYPREHTDVHGLDHVDVCVLCCHPLRKYLFPKVVILNGIPWLQL